MTLICICVLVWFLPMCDGIYHLCPSPDSCICTGSMINCTCSQQQDVRLFSVTTFETTNIMVRGCRQVTLSLGFMSHHSLEELHFSYLQSFLIEPFAMGEVKNLGILKIHNIENLNIQSHGIGGLENVSLVDIRNVKMGHVPLSAFGVFNNIQKFQIFDSTIETLEPLAFIMSNIDQLIIANSYISELQNSSMILHNIRKLAFINSSIHFMERASLNLENINEIIFKDCHFNRISGEAISAKVGKFRFQGNTVEVVESKAFWNVAVEETVVFCRNNFSAAEPDSLIPNNGPNSLANVSLDISNNFFSCDYSLAWMWKSAKQYEKLLYNGFCWGPSSELIDKLMSNLTIDSLTLTTLVNSLSTVKVSPRTSNRTTLQEDSTRSPSEASTPKNGLVRSTSCLSCQPNSLGRIHLENVNLLAMLLITIVFF
ncbi:uncharacterized protein LOC143241655 [Tachypleus tridentatus]|uniref:uncharacterized protein LOC143241655 n=1 Tax=Tachypleus tridentatus TaxID=6853 RepID=UPI003FD2FBAC